MSTVLYDQSSKNYYQPLFDEKRPYDSLANFMKEEALLDHEQQQAFLKAARCFFTEAAYFDKTIEIPSELKSRFVYVLQRFVESSTTEVDNILLEKRRLVAIVAKVSRKSFKKICHAYRVRQLEVSRSPSDSGADYWHFTSVQTTSKSPLNVTERSEEALKADHAELDQEEAKLRETVAIPHPFFEPEHPYESIDRFARRFAVLSRNSRLAFCVTVSKYFATQVFNATAIPLPDKLKDRFKEIDLQLLLREFSRLKKEKQEQDRLVTNIERVAGEHFETAFPTRHVQIGTISTWMIKGENKLISLKDCPHASDIADLIHVAEYQMNDSPVPQDLWNHPDKIHAILKWIDDLSETSLKDSLLSLLAGGLEKILKAKRREVVLAKAFPEILQLIHDLKENANPELNKVADRWIRNLPLDACHQHQHRLIPLLRTYSYRKLFSQTNLPIVAIGGAFTTEEKLLALSFNLAVSDVRGESGFLAIVTKTIGSPEEHLQLIRSYRASSKENMMNFTIDKWLKKQFIEKVDSEGETSSSLITLSYEVLEALLALKVTPDKQDAFKAIVRGIESNFTDSSLPATLQSVETLFKTPFAQSFLVSEEKALVEEFFLFVSTLIHADKTEEIQKLSAWISSVFKEWKALEKAAIENPPQELKAALLNLSALLSANHLDSGLRLKKLLRVLDTDWKDRDPTQLTATSSGIDFLLQAAFMQGQTIFSRLRDLERKYRRPTFISVSADVAFKWMKLLSDPDLKKFFQEIQQTEVVSEIVLALQISVKAATVNTYIDHITNSLADHGTPLAKKTADQVGEILGRFPDLSDLTGCYTNVMEAFSTHLDFVLNRFNAFDLSREDIKTVALSNWIDLPRLKSAYVICVMADDEKRSKLDFSVIDKLLNSSASDPFSAMDIQATLCASEKRAALKKTILLQDILKIWGFEKKISVLKEFNDEVKNWESFLDSTWGSSEDKNFLLTHLLFEELSTEKQDQVCDDLLKIPTRVKCLFSFLIQTNGRSFLLKGMENNDLVSERIKYTYRLYSDLFGEKWEEKTETIELCRLFGSFFVEYNNSKYTTQFSLARFLNTAEIKACAKTLQKKLHAFDASKLSSYSPAIRNLPLFVTRLKVELDIELGALGYFEALW